MNSPEKALDANTMQHSSRNRFVGLATTALAFAALSACSTTPGGGMRGADKPLPIIFVHGNGDTAALWHTTLWRFESNGWPRDRLFAMEFAVPGARSDNSVPQEGRSGTQDQLEELAATIDRVRALTGAPKVILIGNSRGRTPT